MELGVPTGADLGVNPSEDKERDPVIHTHWELLVKVKKGQLISVKICFLEKDRVRLAGLDHRGTINQ